LCFGRIDDFGGATPPDRVAAARSSYGGNHLRTCGRGHLHPRAADAADAAGGAIDQYALTGTQPTLSEKRIMRRDESLSEPARSQLSASGTGIS
jgi:hypothetical protein